MRWWVCVAVAPYPPYEAAPTHHSARDFSFGCYGEMLGVEVQSLEAAVMMNTLCYSSACC
jgi:hypothetical protein